MILFDKRKALASILGPEDGETSVPSEAASCMEEFIQAVHEKNTEGALAALKSCLLVIDSEE